MTKKGAPVKFKPGSKLYKRPLPLSVQERAIETINKLKCKKQLAAIIDKHFRNAVTAKSFLEEFGDE